MKILAILLSPPVPATAGHRVRNRSLLEALALEGHEVTVIAFASREEIASPAAEFAGLCREFHLLPSPESSAAGRLCAAFGTKPYGAIRLRVPAMRSLVREHLAKESLTPSSVTICTWRAIFPKAIACRLCSTSTTSLAASCANSPAGERNPLKKWYAALEARKIERLEAVACASAQAVAVCSARDGELLRELSPTARLFVAANVVDTGKYLPAGCGASGSVLFVGAMDWLPNQDGAEFLLCEILPHLRKLAPNAQGHPRRAQSFQGNVAALCRSSRA